MGIIKSFIFTQNDQMGEKELKLEYSKLTHDFYLMRGIFLLVT